ncbi:MAG: hypothetical protein Ta2G_12880 [Termitinemataceae bacterium]|nr:MAG: hypothetical protein Ta2G_12880 [Termitinemataceae bacterium]
MAKAAAGKGTSTTPGSQLKKKIEEFGLSKSSVAKLVGQNSTGLQKILDGKKGITIEQALVLGKYFGTGESFWIDIQRKFGLDEAKRNSKLQKKLKDLKKAEKVVKGAKGAKASAGKGKKTAGRKPAGKKAAAKKPAAKKAAKKPAAKKPAVKKAIVHKPLISSTSFFDSSNNSNS